MKYSKSVSIVYLCYLVFVEKEFNSDNVCSLLFIEKRTFYRYLATIKNALFNMMLYDIDIQYLRSKNKYISSFP